MDPALWFAMLCGGATCVGLFWWKVATLLREGQVIRCPACGGRISKWAIRKDLVRCPRCDWRVAR